MVRTIVVALGGFAALTVISCTTEACACSPALRAVVTGRVVDEGNAPVPGAQAQAFSAPAAGCRSLHAGLAVTPAESDGTFRLDLAWDTAHDDVCVLIFARPPDGSNALGDSDTTLLVMDFTDEPTPDSAQVELRLRAR